MTDDEANAKSSRNSCVAVSILSITAVFVIFRFTPIYGMYRHLNYYPEAESVANSLKALTTELGELDEAGVRRLLGTEEYRHLEAREIEVDLQPHELIWFRANEMFNIGLGDDGRILWMVDGKRPPEY